MLKKKEAIEEWEREFGDIEKVTDFSGRRMARSAYNNHHSKFGWTVACILPESKDGAYMTHNMICCNNDTYEEKGENFPLFTANGHSYAIKEIKNSYKILLNNARNEGYVETSAYADPDFRKGAEGIEYWHKCEDIKAAFFAGYVKINITTDQFGKLLLDRIVIFIETLFNLPVMYIKKKSEKSMELTLTDFNLPTKDDTKRLLSKCITLYTYANFYFNEVADCKLNIYCGMKEYVPGSKQSFEKIMEDIIDMDIDYAEGFAIDELIKKNTRAGERKQLGEPVKGFYKFNLCYKDLRSELINIINSI